MRRLPLGTVVLVVAACSAVRPPSSPTAAPPNLDNNSEERLLVGATLKSIGDTAGRLTGWERIHYLIDVFDYARLADDAAADAAKKALFSLLGVPEGTVSSWLSRARAALRTQLGEASER